MISDQSGAIVVWVALFIPVVLLIGSFAVDLSNFYVQKRQLQIKADAAALAGAGDLAEQLEAAAGCDEGLVYESILEYGKERNQLAAYTGEGAEARVEDPSMNAETGLTGDPCSDAVVDVTVRETEVPFFLQLTRSVDEIKARARVELQTVSALSGVAPLGVPLPPTSGAVIVNGNRYPLSQVNSTTFTRTLAGYTIPAATDVDLELGGTTIQDIGYVRGWSPTSSTGTNPPELGQVTLEPNLLSCTSADDKPPLFFASRSNCRVGVEADVDFNDTPTATQLPNQRVYAVVNGTDYQLTYNPTSRRWRRTQMDLPVNAGAGAVPISIRFEQINGRVGGTTNRFNCTTTGSTADGCRGTFGMVARPYNASPEDVSSWQVDALDSAASWLFGFYTAQLGSVHALTFNVGVSSNLGLGGAIRTLRPTGANQTGGINCTGTPGTPAVWHELFVAGCQNTFQLNTRDSRCAPVLDPLDCADVRTGNAPDVDRGLSNRIGSGATCSPNDYPGEDGDPRLISVLLVDYGSFGGSGGAQQVPIRGFAWFYITGWTDNQGRLSSCTGADGAPSGVRQPREIFGRFVRRVDTPSSGQTGTGEPCQMTDIRGCVAVMTH